MKNIKIEQNNDKNSPSVAFESLNTLMGVCGELEYIEDDTGQFLERYWSIIGVDYKVKGLFIDDSYDIFFRTRIMKRDISETLNEDGGFVIKPDKKNGVTWVGYSDINSSFSHINACSELCGLKFNEVLSMMNRAIEIDIELIQEHYVK